MPFRKSGNGNGFERLLSWSVPRKRMLTMAIRNRCTHLEDMLVKHLLIDVETPVDQKPPTVDSQPDRLIRVSL